MYPIDKKGDLTISEYLYRCIKNDILTGKIRPGEKLPSKRRMSAECGVSLTCVETAYDILQSEGYIRSEYRRGYFAEELSELILPSPEKAPMPQKNEASPRHINDDEKKSLFPFSVWSRLMRTVISEYGDKLLDRMPLEGAQELRQEISNYLWRSIGVFIDPHRIIIGAGTEYLCSLILTLLGRAKIYAVEDPGYKKIPTVYSLGGAPVRYLPTDYEGILPEALLSSGASVLHISPQNQFPTGFVMTIQRRQKLISWLSASEERYIIEDDFDSELRLSGRRIAPLMTIDPTGRTIYMNTFTSTIAPSFRVGYLVLPEALATYLRTKAGAFSCTVTAFEQYTLAKFIGGGYFERHINRCRAAYKKKKEKLVKILSNPDFQKYLEIIPSQTGINVLVKIGDTGKAEDIRHRLTSSGFAVPLDNYCKNPPEKQKNILVINYSELWENDMEKIENTLTEALKK